MKFGDFYRNGHLKENNIWGWCEYVYILDCCIWQHGEGWSALPAQVKYIPLIKSQFLLTTPGNLSWFPQTGLGTSLCVLSHFSHARLCNPMNCSPPGFSVQGIFQARILEQVAISFSKAFSQPRIWTCVSYFLHWVAGCSFYGIALITRLCNCFFTGLCATLTTIEGRELVFDFCFWLVESTLSILLNKPCRIWQGWLEGEFENIWDQIFQNREVYPGPTDASSLLS